MKQNTLLIVDDSKTSRSMTNSILKELNPDISILQAKDAQEALNIVAANDISYLSIDFNMPGMNGLELAKKIIPAYPDSKIALLTADIQPDIRRKCEEINVACINKPISKIKLQKMLEYFDA